ncbi:MAG: tetratricopeptide repeat protein [Kiloniellales bacterium]|nr:tetratricopeptide repeat protein [Kiloniellales bacterium]
MSRHPLCALFFLTLLAAGSAAGREEPRLVAPFDAALLEERLAEGQEAARAGDDAAAIEHLTRAAEIADLPQPERARVHNERGRALLRLGRRDKALLDFHRAIRLDATVADSWYRRGALRAQLGEPAPALKDLTEALRLDPGLAPAYRTRSGVLIELRRFAEAEADLRALLGRDRRNPETHLELGRLHLMMDEPWTAFRDFTRVLQLDPDHPQATMGRGRASFFLGQFAAAAADFGAARKRSPEDPAAALWFRVAALRSGLGDPSEAAPEGDVEPGWPAPVLALLEGRLEEPALLELARDGDPGRAALRETEAQFFLAQRDLLAGEPGPAEARLRGILESGPGDSAAHQGARAELTRLAAEPAGG